MEKIAILTETAKKLMKEFWPGPLTLVLKIRKDAKTKIPKEVTAGLNTVAVRMPANKIALELIKRSEVPIAAPSANVSGRPSPTTAQHVAHDLGNKVDLILDGGKTKIGLESTVIDLSSKIPVILRPGKITLDELQKVVPNVTISHSQSVARSPGMKHRHYAPKAKIILVEEKTREKTLQKIQTLANNYMKKGKKIAILSLHNQNLQKVARELFFILRELDGQKVEIILSETVQKKGIGIAIMDRLERAAK
ncbi:threonylcarbamoyl-AMP synthase [Candidatus Micrarchaeota archaeon]|nr:threonylcarbamoyl-AMP synthase [Candidatus Micrarchaeota archaeon]